MEYTVKNVKVEPIGYQKYVEMSLDRLADVVDFLDLADESITNKPVEAITQDLINQFPSILESVSFLIEHSDDSLVNKLLEDSDLIQNISKLYLEKIGAEIDSDPISNSSNASKIGALIAQHFEDVVSELTKKANRAGYSIHDIELSKQIESLYIFSSELWNYISFEADRPAIIVNYANPFRSVELYDPSTGQSHMERKIDSIGIVNFSHAVGSAMTHGNQKIKNVERNLFAEAGALLRPYLVVLFDHFPEVVNRISAAYFDDMASGNDSYFSNHVRLWASNQYSRNKPDSVTPFDCVSRRNLTVLSSEGEEAIGDIVGYNLHPFHSPTPKNIGGSRSKKSVDITFSARHINRPVGQLAEVSHFELKHLDSTKGTSQNICIN